MDSLRRRMGAALIALLIGTGLAVVALQTPVSASYCPTCPSQGNPAWSCPDGTACVYTSHDGTGWRQVLTFSAFHDGGCHTFHQPMWRTISSVRVLFAGPSDHLQMWFNDNCTGSTVETSSFGLNFYAPYDNAWQSFKILP